MGDFAHGEAEDVVHFELRRDVAGHADFEHWFNLISTICRGGGEASVRRSRTKTSPRQKDGGGEAKREGGTHRSGGA